MTTVHFIMITTEDGEEIRNDCSSKFKYSHEAEEIMQSMECGVFDDDYVHYVPTKIVYELEEGDIFL